MAPPAERPLRPVRPAGTGQALRTFCGHCGRTPEDERADKNARVCPTCGMGVLLQAPQDAAPSTSDPFLVVDDKLTVCALSRQAERLLGLSETEAVNRHVGELLVPADTESSDRESLAAVLTWAARGDAPLRNIIVRPANTFGVRFWARVGSCGPPNAALLVLADAG